MDYIFLNLSRIFEYIQMSFEAIVDNRRKTLEDGNSSPWAYGSTGYFATIWSKSI